MENVEIKNGCVDPVFIKNHDLSIVSTPEDFMDAIFSYEKNPYCTTKKEYFSFALIMKWTNLKAVLALAGAGVLTYKYFNALSIKEVRQHIGLYIFNSLTPSPRIE